MLSLHKLASALLSGGIKGHFGQWAEDVLIRKFFDKSKKDGVYLDIGAHHPFTHSNTAYFWLKGWAGINVDANPNTIQLFEKHRPQDKNIWSAVIPQADYNHGVRQVSLMLPSHAGGATGVAATGTVSQSVGAARGFLASQQVPAISVCALIEKESIATVDYLNVDIEGYDEAVLGEIDFSVVRPSVVSVEDYSEGFEQLVDSSITRLMRHNGYRLAGRAGLTSIFSRQGQ